MLDLLGKFLITMFFLSVGILVLNNIISIGFFLYEWSTTDLLAQSAWSAFCLWISTLVLSGVICMASYISIKAIDRATFKYSRKK